MTWYSPTRIEDNEHQRTPDHLLIYICLITSAFSLLYVATSLAIGFDVGVILMLVCFATLLAVLFIFRASGLFHLSANLYLGNCFFVAVLGCSFFSGGTHSPVFPWFVLIPVAGVLLHGCSRDALFWFLLSGATTLMYGLADMQGFQFPVLYDQGFENLFGIICILGLVMILFFIALTFDHNRNIAMTKLMEKSELLENLVSIDALTEIPNRRAFDQMREQEWGRGLRSGLPISFAIIDIDLFKEFNDNYGHGAGDECLVRVAQALHGCIQRPGDFLARYGGEEFAAILSNTDLDGAMRIAEQFHAALVALKIPHAFSTVAPHVTISIGIATTTPVEDLTFGMLSVTADNMLYAAKNSGRNTSKARILQRDGMMPTIPDYDQKIRSDITDKSDTTASQGKFDLP